MPNLYIEGLPKGCPEGSATDDFVVEGHADHVLATFKTKKKGINRAVINLKTANALGLGIPDKLLALADEVVE